MAFNDTAYTMPSLSSIFNVVEVLNTPGHADFNKAAKQLGDYVREAYSRTLKHPSGFMARLNDQHGLAECMEHSQNLLYLLEHVDKWPSKLMEEKATALTIHWMYLLYGNDGAFFSGYLQNIAADWTKSDVFAHPSDEADLDANVGQGRELIKHLDTLLLDGHLKTLQKIQPDRAYAIGHHVYWWLRLFGLSQSKWDYGMFKKDGRLEWVRICIVKAYFTMEELAKEWRKVEEWGQEPKVEF